MIIIEWLNSAAEYAVIIPGAIFCLFPVTKYLRISPKKLLITTFTGLIALCLLVGFIDSPDKGLDPNAIFIPLMFIALLCYFWVVKLEKLKLLYIFVCAITILSFAGLANHMVEANINPDGHSYEPSGYGLLVQYVLSFIILAIFFTFFYKKAIWIIDNFHIKSVWSFVWLVPISIAACNFAMIPNNYANVKVGRIQSIYFIIEGVLLFLFLLFQFAFYMIAKTTTEKIEAEKNSQMLQMQANQYETLQAHMEQTQRLRHDFRHMANTAGILAREEKYDELINYLDEYNSELDSNYSKFFFCNHPAANAILSYYADLAVQKEIKMNWQVELPNELSVADVDLCAIIGNLLENSIRSCVTVPPKQRYINLSIDIESGKELYIVAVNSFDGIVKKKGNNYISTKNSDGGIGLISITVTAKKYNGIAQFHHCDKEFYAEIMLKLL